MNDTNTLKEVSLFSAMDDTEINDLLTNMEGHKFEPGQTIVQDQVPSGAIHVILQGTVEYLLKDSAGGEVPVDTATIGDFFGELSMLSGEPALFQIRAKDRVRTQAMSQAAFDKFMLKHPRAGTAVIKALSLRLYRTESVSRNVNELVESHQSFGQWLADRFAANVGSWFFIVAQSLILVVWVAWNTLSPVWRWDSYPFIFMNLALSLQAAYAAPIIMMSQNRASNKDRIAAQVDHQVNVKAEVKTAMIMARLDDLEKSLTTLHKKHSSQTNDTK